MGDDALPAADRRLCAYCSNELRRHKGEHTDRWEARRFCSVRHQRWFQARGGGWPEDPRLSTEAAKPLAFDRNGEPIVSFPGAHVRVIDEAPARCPCGAPWQPFEGGVRCVLCSKHLYVAEMLEAAVARRGFGRAN